MSIKRNFPIKTSGVLLVFDNLMYSRFIELVESYDPKTNSSLKEVITILKRVLNLYKVSSKDT